MSESTAIVLHNTAIMACIAICVASCAYFLHSPAGLWSLLLCFRMVYARENSEDGGSNE